MMEPNVNGGASLAGALLNAAFSMFLDLIINIPWGKKQIPSESAEMVRHNHIFIEYHIGKLIGQFLPITIHDFTNSR